MNYKNAFLFWVGWVGADIFILSGQLNNTKVITGLIFALLLGYFTRVAKESN